MKVFVDDKACQLNPRKSLGKGGEAEVYRYGHRLALKVFKREDHPDLATQDQRDAARLRLREHQRKLPSFPSDLPGNVVAPISLARDAPGGDVVGYTMNRIRDAELLFKVGEPRARRSERYTGPLVTRILLDLLDTVHQVHRRDVVLGDFNDLNVLVKGDKVFLIDADSFQFDSFLCRVYTDRFVDPLVCDSGSATPLLSERFSTETDWYAFAVMAMRTLLGVGPYGGVHRPRHQARRVPHGARPMQRVTVYSRDVLYPKPALHYSVLSAELNDYFQAVFCRDHRGPMPRRLLENLDWVACPGCRREHCHDVCPTCRSRGPKRSPRRVAGGLGIEVLREGAAGTAELRKMALEHRASAEEPMVRLEGDRLLRHTHLGPELIGEVVGKSCHYRTAQALGAGIYSAGSFLVGFVFDPERGGINDCVPLPRLRGRLISTRCVVADERAWFFLFEALGRRLIAHLLVVDASATPLARQELDLGEVDWMTAAAGANAFGPYLFVPTDEGIQRFEVQAGRVRATRSFVETEPYVESASRLLVTSRGIYVSSPTRTLLLTMKGPKP